MKNERMETKETNLLLVVLGSESLIALERDKGMDIACTSAACQIAASKQHRVH